VKAPKEITHTRRLVAVERPLTQFLPGAGMTWFTDEVEALLSCFQVARAAADPACVPRGSTRRLAGPAYYRLHGSPEVYHSAYGAEYVTGLGNKLARLAAGAEVWCAFDNTARGEATNDALLLRQRFEHAGASQGT